MILTCGNDINGVIDLTVFAAIASYPVLLSLKSFIILQISSSIFGVRYIDFADLPHRQTVVGQVLGLYSLSDQTSYRKISWSLEAVRFGCKLFQSLWNLAGTSAALLPRCLSNFKAIRPLQNPISRLRDFTRFGDKTSCRLVDRGPVMQRASRREYCPCSSIFICIWATVCCSVLM